MIGSKFTMKVDAVCRDKDGNIKWTTKTEIPVKEEVPVNKEKRDGGENHDARS